jgi:hypothetical protein
MIPGAQEWNDEVRRALGDVYWPGVNVDIVATADGRSLHFTGDTSWEHPWKLHPFWSVERNAWCVRVNPGFVNGRDVVISIELTSKKGKISEDVPLTATEPAENQVTPNGQFEDDEGPYLVLKAFDYPLVSQGTVGGSRPDFFKSLGVRDPDLPDANLLAAMGEKVTVVVVGAGQMESVGERELVSADVILVGDHPGQREDVVLNDPKTGSAVVYSPVFTPTFNRYPFRLNTVAKYVPPEPSRTSLLDLLGGTYSQPNYEVLHIGRVWLVSPPNPPLNADGNPVPDSTWQAYPQHFVFWNLGFAGVNDFTVVQSEPITIHTGLAFGLLDSIGNSLLAPINDITAAAMQAFAANDLTAYFWTAP